MPPVPLLVPRLVLLLASYVPPRLIRSPTGSAACLIPFASLIVSSSCPLPRIARLPASSTSGAGRKRDPHRREDIGGGWRGCLLFSGRREVICCGWRRAVIGGEWRTAAGRGCLLALGSMDGAARSSLFFHLIGSSNRLRHPRVIPSDWLPGHPIDGEVASFPFRPTPSRLPFSACLPGACSPVPGRGMCGLRHDLRWRAGGLVRLLAIVSVPLVPLLISGALWGVLRPISAAYLSALAFLNICH